MAMVRADLQATADFGFWTARFSPARFSLLPKKTSPNYLFRISPVMSSLRALSSRILPSTILKGPTAIAWVTTKLLTFFESD